MGERLTVAVTINNEVIANAYYGWGGVPSDIIQIAQNVLETLKVRNSEQSIISCVYDALANTGASLSPEEVVILRAKGYDLQEIVPINKYDGYIAFSEEGRQMLDRGADYHATISVENLTANLSQALKSWHRSTKNEDLTDLLTYQDLLPTTDFEMNLSCLSEQDLIELYKVSVNARNHPESVFQVKGREELFYSPF